MIFKICSKFNTVEFEADKLPTVEYLQKVYDLISSIEVKEEDMPQRAVKKEQKKVTYADKPASEGQLKAMGWMGIKIPNNCTMAQARALMMKWNQEHPKED